MTNERYLQSLKLIACQKKLSIAISANQQSKPILSDRSHLQGGQETVEKANDYASLKMGTHPDHQQKLVAGQEKERRAIEKK